MQVTFDGILSRPYLMSSFLALDQWWLVRASKANSDGLNAIRSTDPHLQPKLNLFFFVCNKIVFFHSKQSMSSFVSLSLGCPASSTFIGMLDFLSFNQISIDMCCHVSLICPGPSETVTAKY